MAGTDNNTIQDPPAGIAGSAAFEGMTRLHHLLDRQLVRRSGEPAVMDHDGRLLTNRDFAAVVERAAHALRAAGVLGGDRVMLVGENCVALAAFLLACSRIDAWAVPINARFAAAELDRFEAHCRPRALVYFSGISDEAEGHAERRSAPDVDLEGAGTSLRIVADQPGEPEPVVLDPARQVAVMLYTSGTTGQPKGVMLTHGNFLYAARQTAVFRGLTPEDHVYGVLPMSHVFGLTSVFLGTIAAGATVELLPRFDPAHLAAALATRVSVLPAVPTMHARLQVYLDSRGLECQAPRLRYLSSGGAPLDLRWRREVEARFGINLNNGYGLTESTAPIIVSRIEEPRPDASIGRPLEGSQGRIVGTDGRDLPSGEVGEVWLRGPGIMLGYYRDPETTAAVLNPDGWFKSGDLGFVGEDGAFFIVGRSKELIIRSGFNVYPGEVEAALTAHPAIGSAVVVGCQVVGDEQIVAFVTTVAGGAVEETVLRARLRDHLAAYKVPTRIVFVPSLPTAATGKVLRHKLAEEARRLFGD